MGETGLARRAATVTLVVISIVVVALALWKIRIVIALLFLAFTLAAAMRPGVEWLQRRAHIPRGLGVLLHYVVFLAAIGLLLWLIVPRASLQVQHALGGVPTSASDLHKQAVHSTGIKHEILSAIYKRLKNLPSGTSLIHPALSVTRTAFEVLVAIFFTFAVAAYWIIERDRTIGLVQSLVARRHRRVTRDTWVLIDQKLGAFVRGQLLLIALVAALLSLAFWLDGEPYWLLLGIFAGIFEIVPVVGPLLVGVLAIGVGLTVNWQTAVGAAIAVLVVRQLEDYLVTPRVMGHAVGLSPLLVLVSVTTVGILLGGLWILLAIPIASVVATLVDVIVRNVDPAEVDAPALLFAAKDSEG
jgi:predicted PurR-regulated permease PerM